MLYICLLLYSTGDAFADRYDRRYEKKIFEGIVTIVGEFREIPKPCQGSHVSRAPNQPALGAAHGVLCRSRRQPLGDQPAHWIEARGVGEAVLAAAPG